MKKTNLILLSGAVLFSVACTNTTTEGTTNTTAETTTDATAGDATSPGAAATGSSSVDGTTATGTTADEATTATNLNDATFMMTAASANMLEIQAGRLATQNGMSANVKQYGQMMVDHHTKANQEVMALGQKLGTEIPTMLMPMHQEMLTKLTGKTGKEFDESFMDMMETSHKMTIAMFVAKSANAENAEVKALATKMLPTLRAHLEAATRLEDTVD